jgi:hypothetical protein
MTRRPYKTNAGGRRFYLAASAINGRQYLVALDGTRATFECKAAGHRMTHDYGKGPIPKRVPAQALQKMAAYWGLGLQQNGVRGHVNGWCQKCQDLADGVSATAVRRQIGARLLSAFADDEKGGAR